MKIETWNTGRLYSAAGQRIAATSIEGVTFFVDADRGLDGKFETDTGWSLRADVMDAYDNAPFDSSPGMNCTVPRYSPIGYEAEEKAIKEALYAAASKGPGVYSVTTVTHIKETDDRTFTGPVWAWGQVWETLEMDAHSTAFDPALRQQIQDAIDAIKEAD